MRNALLTQHSKSQHLKPHSQERAVTKLGHLGYQYQGHHVSHLSHVSTRLRAAVNYDPPSRRKDVGIERQVEVRRQEGQSPADSSMPMNGDANRYVPLNEAQEIIRRAVNASTPESAKLLPFCETGAQELRVLNYTINGTLVALTLFAALSNVIKPNDLPAVPDFFGGIVLASHKLWDAYSFNVDTHPLMTKAIISGAVYGLGDFTAQTYEGRSWRDFDPVRMLRSAVCGFALFGPLSHIFYQQLDRYFIISKYFDGGDAWYTPLAKILVDQTAFAFSWNTLYLVMLGALNFSSPSVIASSAKNSWWDNLKAGWRIWPLIHLVTYTYIPCEERVLWVNMVELAWVTVLCFYGQQKREKAGAAACSLPGSGVFTDDILRSMAVESQVTFLKADQAPVVKRLDEVLVEAALLEANFGASPYAEALPPKAIAAMLPDQPVKSSK